MIRLQVINNLVSLVYAEKDLSKVCQETVFKKFSKKLLQDSGIAEHITYDY
jgi:hypothetical protein